MSLRFRSSRAARLTAAAIVLGVVAGTAAAVSATVGGGGGRGGGHDDRGGSVRESLSGYEETPLALSTSGHGKFRAKVTDEGISWRLSYDDMEGLTVTMAHIHFGATGQSGGISAWLCGSGGPAGTPACPHRRGRSAGRSHPRAWSGLRRRASTRASTTSWSRRSGPDRRT